MDSRGALIISLDFELHWGGFEKWGLGVGGSDSYQRYFLNTREVIPDMLALFEKYEVHATWASVGMLMHETKDDLIRNSPELKPSYLNSNFSAYHYMKNKGIGLDERSDPFHFAHTLVLRIVSTPHQELGSHTFAHFYCNEDGQTPEQFRADLKSAQKAAEKYGTRLKSLVFPRNQFNDAYLKVCWEEGFTSVRSNPVDWFWNIDSTQSESYWKRLNRGLDAYFPVGRKNTFKMDSLQVRAGLPICIPASRLLRPYNPNEYFLNTMKIRRIISEMTRAAQSGEVYHLWWHPHNLGSYPKESLASLEQILDTFRKLRSQYGLMSLAMGEVSEFVMSASPTPVA